MKYDVGCIWGNLQRKKKSNKNRTLLVSNGLDCLNHTRRPGRKLPPRADNPTRKINQRLSARKFKWVIKLSCASSCGMCGNKPQQAPVPTT
jgi:hypothetical protein